MKWYTKLLLVPVGFLAFMIIVGIIAAILSGSGGNSANDSPVGGNSCGVTVVGETYKVYDVSESSYAPNVRHKYVMAWQSVELAKQGQDAAIHNDRYEFNRLAEGWVHLDPNTQVLVLDIYRLTLEGKEVRVLSGPHYGEKVFIDEKDACYEPFNSGNGNTLETTPESSSINEQPKVKPLSNTDSTVDEPPIETMQKNMQSQEADYQHYKVQVNEIAQKPELEPYRQSILDWLTGTEAVHQHAQSKFRIAATDGNAQEADAYSTLHLTATAGLEQVATVFDSRPPFCSNPRSTEEWINKLETRISDDGITLEKYAADSEAIRRFGQSPDELQQLIKNVSRNVDNSRTYLQLGNNCVAWLSVSLADVQITEVEMRLFWYKPE